MKERCAGHRDNAGAAPTAPLKKPAPASVPASPQGQLGTVPQRCGDLGLGPATFQKTQPLSALSVFKSRCGRGSVLPFFNR